MTPPRHPLLFFVRYSATKALTKALTKAPTKAPMTAPVTDGATDGATELIGTELLRIAIGVLIH
jgi:hypothetical protein